MRSEIDRADIIVIGAGIAGASVAAELAASAKVVVLEMEAQAGYHATGRSAAFFAQAYGNAVVRQITRMSEPFFRAPPDGFSDVQLMRPRDCVFFGSDRQRKTLRATHQESPHLQAISAEEVRRRVPMVAENQVTGGLLDETGGDLDVDAVLQGFLRKLKLNGGAVVTGARVLSLSRTGNQWGVVTDRATYRAPVIVNAAGAWADSIATLAELKPLGLQPKRRTAVLIDAPAEHEIDNWPLMVDVEERFYFKPDAGLLLLSPADETPSHACDAQPEELDIAVAVDRLETLTGRDVPQVKHRWAGLRTFAPDKTFVVGFDPREEGFFWLAGQGGYGVQTAPGLARLAAALVNRSELPEGVDARLTHALSPVRLIAAP